MVRGNTDCQNCQNLRHVFSTFFEALIIFRVWIILPPSFLRQNSKLRGETGKECNGYLTGGVPVDNERAQSLKNKKQYIAHKSLRIFDHYLYHITTKKTHKFYLLVVCSLGEEKKASQQEKKTSQQKKNIKLDKHDYVQKVHRRF